MSYFAHYTEGEKGVIPAVLQHRRCWDAHVPRVQQASGAQVKGSVLTDSYRHTQHAQCVFTVYADLHAVAEYSVFACLPILYHPPTCCACVPGTYMWKLQPPACDFAPYPHLLQELCSSGNAWDSRAPHTEACALLSAVCRSTGLCSAFADKQILTPQRRESPSCPQRSQSNQTEWKRRQPLH